MSKLSRNKVLQRMRRHRSRRRNHKIPLSQWRLTIRHTPPMWQVLHRDSVEDAAAMCDDVFDALAAAMEDLTIRRVAER